MSDERTVQYRRNHTTVIKPAGNRLVLEVSLSPSRQMPGWNLKISSHTVANLLSILIHCFSLHSVCKAINIVHAFAFRFLMFY